MEERNLRVSDAEKEHVGQLLQRAVGQGMLSLGEFTERMDTALAAKTRGELNSVVADLPGMQIAEQHRPEHQFYSRPPAGTHGHEVGQRGGAGGDVVKGTMSTVSRKGPWHVPPKLSIESKMSTVTLDFTQAVMSTQVVEVTVNDYCSTISLVVPPEATVDLNAVETVGGSANNKVRTGPPIGPLHVIVRGKVRFGSITAKHPLGTSLRRMFGN
ncbi:DUF1707 domain-containing protein [Rhodococcus sp. G-MC3]|uniref:DUF1707 SHOCT-like domain-containing protein n=1 Tax=Rhodococcus sp. G-MC3 TaxID=3046209 RepID=UPI0024B8CAA9|nr:DUF1707 domain-containing protein [Rhodococcus sp. G-MC3]MDJ0394727.1 DUF1707 domain-containing protein [Rhodococcus sp. G-MC3]